MIDKIFKYLLIDNIIINNKLQFHIYTTTKGMHNFCV